jgi:hypothetical protein
VTAKVKFGHVMGVKSVTQVDSLERADEESVRPVKTNYSFDESKGELTVHLKAYKIASFALNMNV